MSSPTPDLKYIRNWRCTGVNVPNIEGGYHLPPGKNGDYDRRLLLGETIAVLYSAVASAQQMPAIDDRPVHARHQMVVASAAAAAGEADTYLTLASAGLESPALVHLRSLSENVRRLVICRQYPELALELYESAVATWREVAATNGIHNVPAPTEDERTLRQVEGGAAFGSARKWVERTYHILTDSEWAMWSKRVHGDIYALVDVAQRLSNRTADVRYAINIEKPYRLSLNIYLMRCIGVALLCLGSIIKEFGMQCAEAYRQLETRYGVMQERDRQSGALRLPEIGVSFLPARTPTTSSEHS